MTKDYMNQSHNSYVKRSINFNHFKLIQFNLKLFNVLKSLNLTY